MIAQTYSLSGTSYLWRELRAALCFSRPLSRLLSGLVLIGTLAACDSGQLPSVAVSSSVAKSATVARSDSGSSDSARVQTSTVPEAGAVTHTGDKTLRLGYIGPAKSVGGPVGWGLEQGIIAEALRPLGFKAITQHVFPNGPDLNEALLSGNLDVGVYGDTPALFARASGGDTRLLGFNNVAVDAWLVAPAGGVETPADLAGKRVGVPRGSYLHRYLSGLQVQGVVKEIEEVHLFPRDAQPALVRGDIAAYTAPAGLGPQLKAQGFKVIDQASQHGLQGNSLIVARSAFLQAHPGFAAAFDQARERAAHDLHARPDDYYAYYLTTTAFTDQVVRESYPLSVFNVEAFPQQGLALLEGTKAFLLANGLAKDDFQLADWQWREPSQTEPAP